MTEIIQNSFVCRFFLGIWAVLCKNWPESGCAALLDRLGNWAKRTARESALCRFLARDGVITRSWEGSLIHRIVDILVDLPGALCRRIYRGGKRLLDESLLFRGLSALGRQMPLLLGAFLIVMLVVPHDYWNNLYALAGALLLTAVFVMGNAAREDVRLEAGRLGPHFALYLCCVAAAFITTEELRDSVRFVAFYLILFLLVLLTVSAIRDLSQLKLLVGMIMAGLTVAALYGCYQAIVGVEVDPSQQDLVLNLHMPGRIYSFFDNPNNFAEILVMFIPFDFALFLNAKTWKGRGAALFSLAACVAALGATLSRSSYLGFVLAVMVFLLLENWKLVPLCLLLGLCCFPLLPRAIFNRILTIGNTSDTSTSYRFAIFDSTGILLKDFWLKGVGLGSDVLVRTFRTWYQPMYNGNYPLHTHNNYLQVWAETGIVGALAYLGTLLYQLKRGVRAYRASADKRLKRFLAAGVSGMCGIMLVSVAEYTWYYPRNMFFFWVLFALIAACVKLASRDLTKG